MEFFEDISRNVRIIAVDRTNQQRRRRTLSSACHRMEGAVALPFQHGSNGHAPAVYLSNTAQMAMLRPYQRIVGMGWPVVPLILEELLREPDQWFWALEAITEENPVPAEAVGHVVQSAGAWVEWGRTRGLIES